jgi:hypothetical protein
MLFLGLLLLLVFDTIIRNDDESKLKKFWIKKFPNPKIRKLDSKLKKFYLKMYEKINERINEKLGDRKKDIQNLVSTDNLNFLKVEDLINLIPSKYSKRIFIFSIVLIIISLLTIILSLYDRLNFIFTKFF